MYFSYVPSIKFSFFNRPLFLNLLFNRFIIIIINNRFNIIIIITIFRALSLLHIITKELGVHEQTDLDDL